MPPSKTTSKRAVKSGSKPRAKPAAKAARPKASAKTSAKAPAGRMSLPEVMRELEKAGTAQARKIYARHGATGPMFGVSFATLKGMMKRIDVDHELALALWDTGNFDARNLAVKIVDPAKMSPADFDRWAREACSAQICGGYAAMLASETPQGPGRAGAWLASKDAGLRTAGWSLLAQLAQREEALPDAYFLERLAEIERTIHAAPNGERTALNMAVIMIGCRNAALKKAALATAKRIGKVEIDYGDTGCKTPDAGPVLEKTWTHSTSKGFASPAAHERTRDVPRRRC
jgi:hypothetical protein